MTRARRSGTPPAPLAPSALLRERRVIGRRNDDGDVAIILRRRADHGGAPDVDILDQLGGIGVWIRGHFFELVQVHDHHVDRLDGVRRQRRNVVRLIAHGEDRAGDLRVHGLDAAVEHLGKAGYLGDVANREAGVPQGFGSAAGGDQLDAKTGEFTGEVADAGLIGDTDQCAFYFGHENRIVDYE